jgi:hypothetical protein
MAEVLGNLFCALAVLSLAANADFALTAAFATSASASALTAAFAFASSTSTTTQVLPHLQLRVEDHPRAPKPLHALPIRTTQTGPSKKGGRCDGCGGCDGCGALHAQHAPFLCE